MNLSPAREAIELLREELGADGEPELERAVLVAVLGLSFSILAQARGALPGPVEERLRAPGAEAWDGLLRHFAALHDARGGWLFAPARFEALAGRRASSAAVLAVCDRLAGYADAELEVLGAIYESASSAAARRQTSTHYTPSSLAQDIVERSLAPLLRSRRPESLAVCDPAMGSGVFVLAACRALGERIEHPQGRLLAALSCVHGVDEDPVAVALCKLALWLEAGAASTQLRFDCFDHALRCGDALVGLSLEQLRRVDWGTRGSERERGLGLVTRVMLEGARARASLLAVADDVSAAAARRRAELWRARQASLEGARALADEVIGAFFCSTKARERGRALAEVHARLGDPLADLIPWPRRLPGPRPFHWPLEFLRCAPAGADAAPGFDAFVGNPPFAGKNGLIAQRGRAYLDWLKQLHPGAHGNADYAAHFFRRADTLLGPGGGTIGFVATNTIGQGDTRATGLAALLASGAKIYAAREHLEWPGPANVTVSVVHLARGPVAAGLGCELDGARVDQIDSRLRPRAERPDPAALPSSRGRAFIGTYVLGQGFVLTPERRDALIASDPRNAEHIRPYIGGKQLNRSPTQAACRHVIDFGERPLAHAERWPELLDILRREVKPQREALADNPDGRRRKARWWQHGRVTPSLQAALAPLERCLVTSLVSKHLMFAFAPADRLFSHKLCVFPLDGDGDFAVLQSRIHGIWARLLSSTMRNAGLNYSPSDCFETFAWPEGAGAELERAGRALDRARARYMVEANIGLTQTYNALTDPDRHDEAIEELRALHLAVDRAVLAAYGWDELEPPAYLDGGSSFEREIVERLYALNEGVSFATGTGRPAR